MKLHRFKRAGQLVASIVLLGSVIVPAGVNVATTSAASVSTAEYAHKDKKLSNVSKTQLLNDKHNLLYQGSPQYVTTTNGYLTTESTFRPTDIHYAGNTWKKSGSKDYRAVLAYWWPTVDIQVAYLKYMTKNGFASKALSANTASKFTNKTSVATLDEAAQAVRDAMEVRIAKDGNTDYVNGVIQKFTKTQSMWNETSEYPVTGNNWFDNGYFLYTNNSSKSLTGGNTSYANSNYRLLNRAMASQAPGSQFNSAFYDFLLANDIDNSNPEVQAEDLNWAYYLQKFGSKTQGNDNANFDGFRIDAVSNVDTDLLQITTNLMASLYNMTNEKVANQHLSINEDWGTKSGSQEIYDTAYNGYANSQLMIDTGFFNSVRENLINGGTGNLQYFIGKSNVSITDPLYQWNSIVDRSNDSTYNEAEPNYSFVRAHDTPTQDMVSGIISTLHPELKDPMRSQFKMKYIKEAFDYYYQMEAKADKGTISGHYQIPYNIPSAYALLLTNKDTVPRVYYGDLYKESYQYMSKKGMYYDAITKMLKLRQYTVAGGQSMTANDAGDVLVSVRYGTGIADANSDATNTGRNQGSAVIVSNNKDLEQQTITVNMGKAHANQDYTMAIGTGDTDLTYDQGTYTTDADGKLQLTIKGYANNPYVRGYFAYLVPKEMSTTKVADSAEAQASDSSDLYNKDHQVFHSNAALDTHVIMEGFSNFQPFADNNSNYTNEVLARSDVQQNLKDWGITDFEFAPQYRSSTTNEFLDSNLQNGYALTDRYDLGFDKNNNPNPTKYGTATQLANAIEAMHKSGLQVLADYVPNQLYDLDGKEVVTATRVDSWGHYVSASGLNNVLYLTNSVGGGDYQKKYGGEYLDELKNKYPWMFNIRQISNNTKLPTSTKIKQWSAKYLNGTALQGNGAYQVLKDGLTNQYFYARAGKNTAFAKSFLPMSMLAVGYAHNSSNVVTTPSKNTGKTPANKKATTGKNKKFVQKKKKTTIKIPATSGKLTGIKRFNNKYIYYKNGRLQKNTKVKIGKKTYRIDKHGYILGYRPAAKKFTGVKKRGSHYNYYRNNRQLKNTKVKIGKKTYRIDKHGYILGYRPAAKKFTGVKKRGSHYNYYRNNRQLKNTKVKIGKKTYRIDKHGYILGYRPAAKKFTGVKKRGSHYNYYRNNHQLKNTKVKIGKKTYRIDKHGYILGYRPAAKKFTGVKKRGKHYVYYRNNRQLKNTKVKIGKKTYRINKAGYLLGYRR